MTFSRAVGSVPALGGAYRRGLGALRKRDRRRVRSRDTRSLAGSVDLDEALRESQPNAERWDYGIGYREGSDEHAIWVEVHAADSHHVGKVIAKARWLKRWLDDNARELLRMTRPRDGFVWVASGRVGLPQGSPEARELAEAGASFPRTELELG
ncbi:MAG: hypothetical protein ACUVYA_04615 [Planctomycetota bacterium]